MFTKKKRSTKIHELTRKLVSVLSCDLVDRLAIRILREPGYPFHAGLERSPTSQSGSILDVVFPRGMFFVSANDHLDHLVTHHVFLGEVNKLDPFQVSQDALGLN